MRRRQTNKAGGSQGERHQAHLCRQSRTLPLINAFIQVELEIVSEGSISDQTDSEPILEEAPDCRPGQLVSTLSGC